MLKRVSDFHMSTGWSIPMKVGLKFHLLRAQACMCVCRLSCFSHVWLCTCLHIGCAILWTIACQAPLSMGFFRQEYWSGLPSSPSGDLPNTGIEYTSHLHLLHWQALAPPGKPRGTYTPQGIHKMDWSIEGEKKIKLLFSFLRKKFKEIKLY